MFRIILTELVALELIEWSNSQILAAFPKEKTRDIGTIPDNQIETAIISEDILQSGLHLSV